MPISLTSVQPKSILVIGDVMLDIYYDGEISRISPEAPVPVFKKKKERNVPGGAANVAANLIAAEQKVFVMTMLGKDEAGEWLIGEFERLGIETGLIARTNRSTTVKTRFLAGNSQQVFRLDIEDTTLIDEELCRKLLTLLDVKIRGFDLLLLSDYMKGFLSDALIQGILEIAKAANVPAIVDVKGNRPEKYRGAYLLKPNLAELRGLTGMRADSDAEIVAASRFLCETCQCRYVLTTCGARGMALVSSEDAGEEPYFVNSTGHEVFDVTGAGDTAIAYLAACMANGFSMRESVDVANCAAGIEVSKNGTSVVSWQEVRESLAPHSASHKLLVGNAVTNFRREHASQKIVFTNGCFDILHVGHIHYLQEAARLGDVLVVGLNSDTSVRTIKGPDRPVNDERDRAETLCALSFVDYVVIFDEDTPLELIKKIQPDVLVKGRDYSEDNVVGADFVRGRGGELVLLPFIEGKSTTKIIEKIRSHV